MFKWIMIGAIVLMPGIFFGIVRDMAMIFWAALPWSVQGIIIVGCVVAVAFVARAACWALTGRSTLRRQYRSRF